MNQENTESNQSAPASLQSSDHNSDYVTFTGELPAEADGTVVPADVDVHGKLAHLNALDLSGLTLNRRYVMITLMNPKYSDDFGRFMTSAGEYPTLPALSVKETRAAIDSLINDKLIETWKHQGSTCWEIAGAYAFKPGLIKELNMRREISRAKKEERAKRRQRKKDTEEAIPFVTEDDGKGAANDGVVHNKILTKRGNLLPDRPSFFFNSRVPHRKKKAQYEMIVNQPDSAKGCILKMLPSFDPTEDLNSLAAVIRFYLLKDCDDYGRVRIDVRKIHSQLGPVITKRVSKEKIEKELQAMERAGHLILFERKNGKFAYIRDAAQHLKDKKRYDLQIPLLYKDRDFTYDSQHYKAFFEACRQHSAKRSKAYFSQFCQNGDIVVVHELVATAAERFLKVYKNTMNSEPFCNFTPEQLCGFDSSKGPNVFQNHYDIWFYHGYKTGFPAYLMEHLYKVNNEEFDGLNGNPRISLIMKHLIGMTPRQYVGYLKSLEENGRQHDPSDDASQDVQKDEIEEFWE